MKVAESRKTSGRQAVRETAARCVVQFLFSRGGEWSLDVLRSKLRESLKEDVDPEYRVAASIPSEEFVTALLEFNDRRLNPAGQELRITGGMVSLWAGPVKNKSMSRWLQAETGESGDPQLSESAQAVLYCVLKNQPVELAEITRIFGAEKRGVVSRLAEDGWIARNSGPFGRAVYSITEKFVQRFGCSSWEDVEKMLSERQKSEEASAQEE